MREIEELNEPPVVFRWKKVDFEISKNWGIYYPLDSTTCYLPYSRMEAQMSVPGQIKIYHIANVDRLASMVETGFLWCDAKVIELDVQGTVIGMGEIKRRRLKELTLASHPDLFVGQCVPFYFCPRSVMLYLLHKGNHPELAYRKGQEPVVHLEADLLKTVQWAEKNRKRWAFTLTNAGSYYFEDRCDLSQLEEINWEAVQTNRWSGTGIPAYVQEEKQAEFLIEDSFPWGLVERIGVISERMAQKTMRAVSKGTHKPAIEVMRDWYY